MDNPIPEIREVLKSEGSPIPDIRDVLSVMIRKWKGSQIYAEELSTRPQAQNKEYWEGKSTVLKVLIAEMEAALRESL